MDRVAVEREKKKNSNLIALLIERVSEITVKARCQFLQFAETECSRAPPIRASWSTNNITTCNMLRKSRFCRNRNGRFEIRIRQAGSQLGNIVRQTEINGWVSSARKHDSLSITLTKWQDSYETIWRISRILFSDIFDTSITILKCNTMVTRDDWNFIGNGKNMLFHWVRLSSFACAYKWKYKILLKILQKYFILLYTLYYILYNIVCNIYSIILITSIFVKNTKKYIKSIKGSANLNFSPSSVEQ